MRSRYSSAVCDGRHRFGEMALRESARPPAVSRNGIVARSVELHGGRFVAVVISGAVVGSFATLNDAREAVAQARR